MYIPKHAEIRVVFCVNCTFQEHSPRPNKGGATAPIPTSYPLAFHRFMPRAKKGAWTPFFYSLNYTYAFSGHVLRGSRGIDAHKAGGKAQSI